MKLIYKGRFDGDPASLPHGEHRPNAVKFKEFDDPKKLAAFANIAGMALIAVLLAAFLIRADIINAVTADSGALIWLMIGCALPMLSLFPHEILHALCFRDEVYLYTNWNQGMLFVVGPEPMSKGRFIFMSLLPNLVFGVIPYLIAWFAPGYICLGVFGALAAGMGMGDYYNVFNALTQMPRGARTYLYQFNSYWYLP